METVLFNATQNARLHGGDAPVQVSAAFSCHESDCDLRLEVINVAGRNHQQLRALRVQELLAADVDFASLGMGTAESTFLGLKDILLDPLRVCRKRGRILHVFLRRGVLRIFVLAGRLLVRRLGPVWKSTRRRVDGVEVDATIQDERAVNLISTQATTAISCTTRRRAA